ncbi:MAG: cryptochrome/photolyase family protein [Microthrixaceae bacterium]
MWFRRDLRLEDQPAWAAATRSGAPVLALHVLDPVALRGAGPFRADLHLGHLAALDADLRARGGGLLIRHGNPAEVVPSVAAAVDADGVELGLDVGPYARRRDRVVIDALRADGRHVGTHWGNLVQAPGAVISPSSGRAHRVFTPFHKVWAATTSEPWPEEVDAPLVDPDHLPGAAAEPLPRPGAMPVMEPGADAAAARLADWLERVDDYPGRRDLPAADDGTSHLSADLRWGTLSPRRVAEVVGTGTEGRAAFVRQLAWRDWYAHLLWEEPRLARHALKPEMDRVAWRDDPAGLAAWAEGRTGYPIVDAGMRQLAATGWMHNRVRMITASFLVKDLLVDWRLGEAHFRRLLVDYEPSQNVGNWQWVAGTGPDAAPYFRIFNPVAQSRKFDPDGDYIRRWVPELAPLDRRAVHAPWEEGPLELATAGVVLGDTYPHPLVDHAAARERTLAAYATARDT